LIEVDVIIKIGYPLILLWRFQLKRTQDNFLELDYFTIDP